MIEVKKNYKARRLPENAVVVDKITRKPIALDGNPILLNDLGGSKFEYNEFAIINLEGLRTLFALGIKQVDLALFIELSSSLMIKENICMRNDEEPHTTATIAALIKNSVQATKKKLNRLIKLDVINYSYTKFDTRRIKVYRVNPFLIKKGKNLNSKLETMFKEIQLKPNKGTLIPNDNF
jgi:hypothetical protein